MPSSTRPLQVQKRTVEQELEQTVAQVLQQANIHQESGQLQAAEELYQAILEINQTHPDANHNLGVLKTRLQGPGAGLSYFRTALDANPECEHYWLSYAEALIQSGQRDAARQVLDLGRRHGLSGAAADHLEACLEEHPNNPPVIDPGQSGAEPPAPAATQKASTRVLEPSPSDLNKLANLRKKGHTAKIEAFAQELTKRYPESGVGWKTLGLLLEQQGRYDEALLPAQKAVELLPEDHDVHNVLGVLMQKKARHAEAEALFDRALILKPDYPAALNNLGNHYRLQGKLADSEKCFRRALEIESNAIMFNNLGATLLEQGRIVEAEAIYHQALKIQPNLALAHINLGVSLRYQGRLTEAIASQRRALELNPDCPEQHSNLLFTLNYTSGDADSAHVEEARKFGRMVAKKVKTPFSSWPCTPRPDRLRVGLVSGDLYNHPVGFFLESVLAQIDASRVEVIAYPTHTKADDLTARLKQRLAGWKPLYGLTDEAAARLIREDGVHVLLDLSGHTTHNRLPMLAWKPAPVQVSWLGYFATTGVSAIDYFLADETGVPETRRDGFTETLWYLPETRLCFTAPQADVAVAPLPALAKGHVTFGCFQKLTKVSDDVLAVWSDILVALPDARIRWQCAQLGDPAVADQFTRRLQRHGIDPERVALLGSASRAKYLSDHGEIDMILDTFPYPGGTTTCEALWMGVPTLTLAGNTLLSRQGASLLTAAGLKDWVAESKDDYVAKAVAFAGELPRLASLRAGLREQVLASPIFDAQRFARNFEDALWGMWQQKQPRDEQQEPIVPSRMEVYVTEAARTKTFLHVGCGPQRKEKTTKGFNTDQWTELRLDINEAVNPDIVGTMTDMSRVADTSVDAIFSSHNIEHLYPHEVPQALNEFMRVLKPDGFVVITCPDLKSVCALIAEDKLTDPAYQSAAGPIAPLDILYGHRASMTKGNLYMAHRCGFTEKVLSGTLRAAGFAAVATMSRPAAFDLWAVASKAPLAEEKIRELAAEHFVR